MLIIRLMTENAIKKFLRVYGKSFPLKKKFNFTGFCKDVKSLIDKDYDYLLMRNRDYYSNRKKREQFKTKIGLLRATVHQNIIKIYDIFEDTPYIYLIMEECNSG